MKPSPKQTQEAHQNYKKVSEHLIREGYAPDQESADDIIKGMSEDWFNLIIEERRSLKILYQRQKNVQKGNIIAILIRSAKKFLLDIRLDMVDI